MRATVKRHGNSRGITIPAAFLERLGWNEGTLVELDVKDGMLVAYALAPSLEAMLASVPQDYREAEEEWGADVGKETAE